MEKTNLQSSTRCQSQSFKRFTFSNEGDRCWVFNQILESLGWFAFKGSIDWQRSTGTVLFLSACTRDWSCGWQFWFIFCLLRKGYGFTSRFVREDVFNVWTSLWPWLKTNQHSCKKILNVYLYFGKYVDSQTSACTNCVVQYLSVDPLQFGFGGRCSTLFRETLDPKISGNQIINL